MSGGVLTWAVALCVLVSCVAVGAFLLVRVLFVGVSTRRRYVALEQYAAEEEETTQIDADCRIKCASNTNPASPQCSSQSSDAVAADDVGASDNVAVHGPSSIKTMNRQSCCSFGCLAPRHQVIAMCLLANMVCYADRTNISVAIIAMQQKYSWSEVKTGAILGAFFGATCAHNSWADGPRHGSEASVFCSVVSVSGACLHC